MEDVYLVKSINKEPYSNRIIKYEFDSYDIFVDNISIGKLYVYKIFNAKYKYIDIFIKEEYRGKGYSDKVIEKIYKLYNELYIIGSEYNKKFLERNRFRLVEEDLYKNLYKRVV